MATKFIEDTFLHTILRNPRYIREFPFLRGRATAQAPAACCGQKASTKAIDYNDIKMTFASMSDAKKLALLKLVGASAVRFVYRNLRGELVKLTIGTPS